MIQWLIDFPLALILTIMCYITNPIIVLFCDDDNELHGFLKNWQTHDNSCCPSDVKKNLPSFLTSFWDKHYVETYGTDEETARYNCTRWFTPCCDYNFTFWEKVQRYICRVAWLTRNCGYTFMWKYLGSYAPAEAVYDGHWTWDSEKDLAHATFCYTNSDELFHIGKLHVYANIYIGTKISGVIGSNKLCMYAMRPLSFKFSWN